MKPGSYFDDAILQFRKLKDLAEKALAQVGDKDFLRALDPESNSIATVMKHIAGNMRSRWTDFLTSDGEKPDRNRDTEFVISAEDSRENLMARWEAGWRCLFAALELLRADDLDRTVLIRGEPHTVLQAVNRQLTHIAYHVGQIVFRGRHFASGNWKSLR